MSYTDENGLVYLEPTDQVAPLHTALNAMQSSVSTALDKRYQRPDTLGARGYYSYLGSLNGNGASLEPIPFVASNALTGLTLSNGVFTVQTRGIYNVIARVFSQDGTANTGHETRVYRNSESVSRSRHYAPAGSSGAGDLRTSDSFTSYLDVGDTFSVSVLAVPADGGGRGVLSAAIDVERLLNA